jgi:hypothetical protein
MEATALIGPSAYLAKLDLKAAYHSIAIINNCYHKLLDLRIQIKGFSKRKKFTKFEMLCLIVLGGLSCSRGAYLHEEYNRSVENGARKPPPYTLHCIG